MTASIKLLAMMTVAANNEALLSQFLPEMNKVVDGMLSSIVYEEGHEGEEPMQVLIVVAAARECFRMGHNLPEVCIILCALLVAQHLWPTAHSREQHLSRYSVRRQRWVVSGSFEHHALMTLKIDTCGGGVCRA
jgi:hypothetical protein